MADGTSLNDLVASEIRAWLGRKQMTGRQLATRINKSQTWMATRLRGETEIGLNDLDLIAFGLEVEVGDLLPQPTYRDERPAHVDRGSRINRGSSVEPGGLRSTRLLSRGHVTTRTAAPARVVEQGGSVNLDNLDTVGGPGDAGPDRTRRPAWTCVGVPA